MRGSRQGGEEEFVDDARTRNANPTLLCASWMGRYHHTTLHPCRPNRHLRAIVEAAHQLAFIAMLELSLSAGADASGRQDDLTRCSHGPRITNAKPVRSARMAPEPYCPSSLEPRVLLRELRGSEVATDGRQGLAQFFAVEPVAAVPKRTEPLVAVGLADNGAGTNHFSPFAPGVARRTDVIQPPKGRWQLFCLRQGSALGRLHVCHRYRRPPRRLPRDPADRRWFSLSRADG